MNSTCGISFTVVGALCLVACASGPDHFYSLQPTHQSAPGMREHFASEVAIRISIPSVIDRNQLVLARGDTVQVLEHERWAWPLTDQITAVLGQDLEQLRPELLVTSSPQAHSSGLPRFAIQLDIVMLTLNRAGPVSMEARWRVAASGQEPSTGREIYVATPANSSAEALAGAVSECVTSLAARLAPSLGPTE